MIQDVAEKNGNMNVDIVTGALERSTQRILGKAYMKAGMGDGGGCHPRDNIAMSYLAKRHNISFNIFEAIMLQRQKYNHWLANICLKEAKGKPILVMGKSFKPETNITTNPNTIQ